MTTQTAVFSGLPTGLTLTKKVFAVADPDTEVTGITGAVTERTSALSEYVVAITKAVAITGDHTIILFLGSTPLAIGKRTFLGTDGEVATVTPEVAVLDAATLIRFVTEDTGETEAADGSVAKLAQGAGGAGGTDWTSEQRTYILAQLALLSLSGSAVVVTSGTFMCARGDVEQVYGNRNVEKWADLNNTADADEILSRINYHIAMADNYIRAAISNGAWVMPESGDTIPAILAYNCARLAGVLMYEARGVSDYDSNGRPIHQLMYHKKSVDDFLKSVLNGSISLAPLTYGITNAAPEAT